MAYVLLQEFNIEWSSKKVSHLNCDTSVHENMTIVITSLAPLASLVHSTNATLHDNTYKRLHGDWKEWEVVVWNWHLNKCMF